MENPIIASTNPWDDFKQDIQNELDVSRRSLKEVKLMLEQSQIELSKLTARNTSITGHLQQLKTQFGQDSTNEIHTTYQAALDAQQRLLLMRSQLEKLQADQTNLANHIKYLEKIRDFIFDDDNLAKTGSLSNRGSEVLEMIVNTQETLRHSLSRQMHDGPAQALSNFILQTEIANRMFDIDNAKAKEELNNLYNSAMSTFQQVRGYIFELRPMMLDDLGLFPTLKRYFESFKEKTGAEVNLVITGQEQRLESYLEVMVFRAIQELVNNVIQHNKDTAQKIQINVNLANEGGNLTVSVSDNGVGFVEESQSESAGLGLRLIRERVDMLGGYMNVDSTPGSGSTITFQVPCLEPGV